MLTPLTGAKSNIHTHISDFIEMSVKCFQEIIVAGVFVSGSASLSVCLLHQSKTTNPCIPDFSLPPVLLYPLRSKSEPCVLSISFFYFVYFCVA